LGLSLEAAASTEVKSQKARQKNQPISFSLLHFLASKLLPAPGANRAEDVTP
jgi:hypothetical protein